MPAGGAKTVDQKVADHASWKPAKYSNAQAAAMQALGNGMATAAQQKMALQWIIESASGTYDWAYRPGPGGERDTLIALGREMVGKQIVKLLKVKIGLLRREEP